MRACCASRQPCVLQSDDGADVAMTCHSSAGAPSPVDEADTTNPSQTAKVRGVLAHQPLWCGAYPFYHCFISTINLRRSLLLLCISTLSYRPYLCVCRVCTYRVYPFSFYFFHVNQHSHAASTGARHVRGMYQACTGHALGIIPLPDQPAVAASCSQHDDRSACCMHVYICAQGHSLLFSYVPR